MATYQPSALVSLVTGRVNTLVFKRSPNKRTIATTPNNRRTWSEQQLAHRQTISNLRAAWSDISQAERDGWNGLALRVSNPLGQEQQLLRRGFDLFLEFNYLPFAYGDAITTTAPSAYLTEPIQQFSIIVNSTIGVFAVTIPPGTAATRYQLIQFAPGWSGARRSKFGPFKRLTLAKASLTTLSLTTEFTNNFGPIRPGQLWKGQGSVQLVGYFPSKTSIAYATAS